MITRRDSRPLLALLLLALLALSSAAAAADAEPDDKAETITIKVDGVPRKVKAQWIPAAGSDDNDDGGGGGGGCGGGNEAAPSPTPAPQPPDVRLMLACSEGRLAEVRALIADEGADADAQPDAAKGGGLTPLMAAASSGFADIVSLLLEKGADAAAAHPEYGEKEGGSLVAALARARPALARARALTHARAARRARGALNLTAATIAAARRLDGAAPRVLRRPPRRGARALGRDARGEAARRRQAPA